MGYIEAWPYHTFLYKGLVRLWILVSAGWGEGGVLEPVPMDTEGQLYITR